MNMSRVSFIRYVLGILRGEMYFRRKSKGFPARALIPGWPGRGPAGRGFVRRVCANWRNRSGFLWLAVLAFMHRPLFFSPSCTGLDSQRSRFLPIGIERSWGGGEQVGGSWDNRGGIASGDGVRGFPSVLCSNRSFGARSLLSPIIVPLARHGRDWEN